MKNTYFSAALLVSATLLSSCGGGTDQQQQAMGPQGQTPEVTAFKAIRKEVNVNDSYPGTVTALQQTELRAEVNGYITGIVVADGARVSKGQKLYEIDRVRYKSAQEQAEANLAIAESNLQKVRTDVKRYEDLSEQDAIASQTLDYAKTDLQNAQAQVASAKAALVSANTDLNRSVIVAPFDGVVGISQVRSGALVSAGTTLLNTISSTSPIAVDIPINERSIPRFVELQQKASDSTFNLMLPDFTRYEYTGKLQMIDRAINPQTGTITARVVFRNPDNKLRVGMNTNLLVATEDVGEQLVIPAKAIIQQLSAVTVFVIGDSSKVVQRTIKVGPTIGDMIVVREGLKDGETIVVDGAQALREGAEVAIADGNQQQSQRQPSPEAETATEDNQQK